MSRYRFDPDIPHRDKRRRDIAASFAFMAEGVRFELTKGFLPYRISSAAR
jgi:hypothetical protein